MNVSHRWKLLFFEVPRTGSRSITAALNTLDPEGPINQLRNDDGAAEYHVYRADWVEAHPDYLLFATHCNPYARLYSHYCIRKQWYARDALKALNFDDYVAWTTAPERSPLTQEFNVDRPITELLPHRAVHVWLRFAHLDEDWQQLRALTNAPLPHLQSSNESQKTSSAPYSETTASAVYERFAQDFEVFGYDKDSWQAL